MLQISAVCYVDNEPSILMNDTVFSKLSLRSAMVYLGAAIQAVDRIAGGAKAVAVVGRPPGKYC